MTDRGLDSRAVHDPRSAQRESHDVLRERARRLAEPLAALERLDGAQNTLVFRRGAERFGIPLDVVVEVHRGPDLAQIPNAAAPVIGVIGWRGRVLTVIDPGVSRPNVREGTEWRAVIVGRSRARVVIYADAVDDAFDARADDCRPLDEAPSSATVRLPVRGITADGIVLVDGEALLERYPG